MKRKVTFILCVSILIGFPIIIHAGKSPLYFRSLQNDSIQWIGDEMATPDDSLSSYGDSADIQDDTNLAEVPDTADIPVAQRPDTVYIKLPDSLSSEKIDSLKTKNLLNLLDTTAVIDISPEAKAILEAAIKAKANFGKYRSFRDTIIANPAFMPIIFDGGIYPKNFQITPSRKQPKPLLSLGRPEWLMREMAKDSIYQRAKYKLIAEHPEKIKYNIWNLPGIPAQYALRQGVIKEVAKVEKQEIQLSSFNIGAPKISYWVVKMRSNLYFSQVAYSENWGGLDNMNIRSDQSLSVNYNPFKKFTFSLKADWILNVNNAPDDTVRNFRIVEDRFTMSTDIGLKAFKGWTYTLTTYFETQLFNNFPANSKKKNASLLSPGKFNVGPGMTYAFTNKKNTFSMPMFNIKPFAYNLDFVLKRDEDLAPSKGIPKGNTLHLFGTTLQGNLWWKIIDQIKYSTNWYYFTNYKSVQWNMTNRLDFSITRLLTANITFYMDYNDTRPKDEKYGYIKYQESLGLGFSYLW